MILLAPAYMFTPLLAGVVTCLVGGPSFETAGLRLPRGRFRWLAIAAAVPIVLVLVGAGIALAVPGVEFVPDANPLTGERIDVTETQPQDSEAAAGPELPGWPWNLLLTVVAALVFGATINAVLASGEEFGWRGVLRTELSPVGFWVLRRSSAYSGVSGTRR
ncbi:hypothetical protein SAMN05443661_1038 [Natronobacterium gregoryi]|uniref:Uncharacterized protein n=1 Tax=Natronobacterium gregoryi TaxID=44930 RepID=A0A1I3JZZ2_9EURY|nr:hypothetical protein SAMN05443661_1038 [Natronobacterium gregoryi]